MSRGVGHRCGLDPTLLWLSGRPSAAAPIWPLARELPYVSLAALKSQKNKQTNKQTNKQGIRNNRVLFTLKRKEILTHTWINLKDRTPSEIIQTLKARYCMIPLTWGAQKSWIHGDRKQREVNEAWLGCGEGGDLPIYCLMGIDFLFGVMKKFWRWIVMTIAWHCEYTWFHLTVHLKWLK